MSYQPREFWDKRLSEHFDLRGTGETGLSLAYNQACYALRARVLTRALSESALDPRGCSVLDVGCGTGFFTAYYLGRGARVTGLDIAPTSVERLRALHPQARFVLADVSEAALDEAFDVVNAFDVLYHITDEERWETAVRHLARAVRPGGLLLLTDTFREGGALAAHNRMRPLSRYRSVLESEGLEPGSLYPTHVLLNRDLGAVRFLNRAPGLLLVLDRVLLGIGLGHDGAVSKLLVSRRPS
ncbi:MAG: class I SAM-dependent methyltransferase [Candidatus Eiseniibacteriota bacterium]